MSMSWIVPLILCQLHISSTICNIFIKHQKYHAQSLDIGYVASSIPLPSLFKLHVLTNFNPIKMTNYRRLVRGTSSPYSHNQFHQTLSYVNFNLCDYLLAAFLLVNFVSSRFARFGGLFRYSCFCFRRNKFSLRISFPPSSSYF